MTNIFFSIILLSIILNLGINAAEEGKLSVTYTGNCGTNFLTSPRGRNFHGSYVPRVSFEDSSVKLNPQRPRVPGCFRVTIEDVEVLERIRKVTAEFEMRIGGSPNPANPTLKCSRGAEAPPACGCGEGNPCLYCGFCQNLRRQKSRKQQKKWYAVNKSELEKCTCPEFVEPGKYDIETEICSTSKEELQSAIPPEQLALIGTDKAVSMFTSVILYDDFTLDRNLSAVSNNFLRTMFMEQRNRLTVGCFQIGMDIQIDSQDVDAFVVNTG